MNKAEDGNWQYKFTNNTKADKLKLFKKVIADYII